MNSDSFFTIGSDHKICEDFALAKDIVAEDGQKISIAIVCDGCSSSGKHVDVDFGARILAYSFLKVFSKQIFISLLENMQCEDEKIIFAFATSALNDAKTILRRLGITDDRFLDATIVFAFANEKTKKVYSGMFGDGTIITKYKSGGKYKIYNGHYVSNMPYYLGYLLKNGRKELYEKNVGENINQFIHNEHIIINDQTVSKTEMLPFDHFFCRTDLVSDLQCISIVSDGIESFLDSGNNKIDLLDVYKEFCDFKTHGGKFVTRRIANGLSDYCKKNNHHHYDDVSCAAIHF